MKRIAALLTLLIWSISMTVSASASMAILCVEKSGVAAIEYSLASHCSDWENASATGRQAVTVAHCVECVDSALTASVSCASPRMADDTTIVQAATYVSAYLAVLYPQDAARFRMAGEFAQHPAMRSTYIGQRKTIVIQQ